MNWDWLGPPLDVRALFPVERALLLDLLGELPDDAWAMPTACPGRTVHDLVAHPSDHEQWVLGPGAKGEPVLPPAHRTAVTPEVNV